MQLHTHLAIDESLSGRVVRVRPGYAQVILPTHRAMLADRKGLIHGGFLFSAADYAAMAAVNDPHVVLGASEVRFLAPVRKGETVIFEAELEVRKGKKRIVKVQGKVEGKKVFEGSFTAFVLDHHILD
ncbi:hotdog domain-containing protein [Nitratifractor sp.]|uniref:hotdog domain-containing protein n=1 Tax=Nitratifractor sp. TaxID=2268144 RepID=UPI0025D6B034|nr:hotdog domain-containing protein [Nitratifractor sp.]